MNAFEKQIGHEIYCRDIKRLQVNLGRRCNQRCGHCHVSASPERREMMEWDTMQWVLHAAKRTDIRFIDLTGGAPELNPSFRRFVAALRQCGYVVQVRTNLTVLFEPGMESLPEFFRAMRIRLVASLPCYLEENVCAQRGIGVYGKSIEAIRQLNAVGYGIEPDLRLDLAYNPGGPFLPPQQSTLEEEYRRELKECFEVVFTSLLAMTNMPLGRFKRELIQKNEERNYLELLKTSFNPRTVERLMCRNQVSVDWDGTLYDCDFNLALGIPVNHGAPDHIGCFSPEVLRNRRVLTGEHGFGCTAGSGSSCSGELV